MVKGYRMTKFAIGTVALMMLGACGSGSTGTTAISSSDGNEAAVCNQQSEWARSGKVDGGEIFITCPGTARPGN